MLNFFADIYKIWLTGLLYCLAGLGYIFYSFLSIVRYMQINKILLIFSTLVLAICLWVLFLFVPIGHIGNSVNINIKNGASVRSVTTMLKDKKVVRSAKALEFWIRLNDQEKSIQAGHYVFFVNEGVFSAAKKLRKSFTVDKVVTIKEGLTIEQTASVISKLFDIDSSKFVSYCNDPKIASKFGINASSLEGYLFPNTYNFNPNAKIEDIVKKMVNEFKKTYKSLTINYKPSKFTTHQIVTMASIIEKEAILDSERPRISGVFYNRLKRKIPLGADPTVRFALRKFSGPLRVSELKTKSPYNTRIYVGLPPGPICSPGKKSLFASLHPADTDELFFVAKWDGSGSHSFSKTNAEHVRKKNRIRRENEIRKRRHLKER